jgi:hypothetical protein
MKWAILCCFILIVFSRVARSDSQTSPTTISPDLLAIFFELWRDSRYGRHPDKIEESVWILKKPSGDYSSIRWPATGKKNAQFWKGPVPQEVVALAHTHTIRADPKPSKKDIAVATRLKIPFYTISEKGIWVVHHGKVKKVLGGEWDKGMPATQTKSSSSQNSDPNSALLESHDPEQSEKSQI